MTKSGKPRRWHRWGATGSGTMWKKSFPSAVNAPATIDSDGPTVSSNRGGASAPAPTELTDNEDGTPSRSKTKPRKECLFFTVRWLGYGPEFDTRDPSKYETRPAKLIFVASKKAASMWTGMELNNFFDCKMCLQTTTNQQENSTWNSVAFGHRGYSRTGHAPINYRYYTSLLVGFFPLIFLPLFSSIQLIPDQPIVTAFLHLSTLELVPCSSKWSKFQLQLV